MVRISNRAKVCRVVRDSGKCPDWDGPFQFTMLHCKFDATKRENIRKHTPPKQCVRDFRFKVTITDDTDWLLCSSTVLNTILCTCFIRFLDPHPHFPTHLLRVPGFQVRFGHGQLIRSPDGRKSALSRCIAKGTIATTAVDPGPGAIERCSTVDSGSSRSFSWNT